MTRGVRCVSSSSLGLAGRVEQHEDRLRRLEEQARQDSRTSSRAAVAGSAEDAGAAAGGSARESQGVVAPGGRARGGRAARAPGCRSRAEA